MATSKQNNKFSFVDYAKKRKEISEIRVGSQHRLIRDKWLKMKRVFDAIYKQLPISAISSGERQIILRKTELLNLGVETAIVGTLLERLCEIGVIPQDKRIGMARIKLAGYMLSEKGQVDVLISDAKLFDFHHGAISEFCSFIEHDGVSRFPAAYGVVIPKVSSVKGEQPESGEVVPETFEVSLNDRSIWVNKKYLIGKPHAIGTNYAFFEYLMANPEKLLKISEFPESLHEEIRGKKIPKLLNYLGFKGEILKLFFPKRGKIGLIFTPRVSDAELEKRGIKKGVLMKQLDLANEENRPV